MNKKFTIFYTIFASLVFLLSIFYFGFNLYNDYLTGSSEVSKKYTTILTKVRSATEKDNSNIAKNVSNSIHNMNDFAFIQVKKDNTVIFSYPNNFTREQTKSNLTKSFDGNFTNSNGKFSIACEIYLLNPGSVSYYAKLSFLMILIITLVTVIMIIYLNVNDNKKNVTEKVEKIADESEDDNSTEQADENTEEETEVTESEQVEITSENEDSSESAKTVTETPKEKIELPYEELKPVQIKVENTEVSPIGLFNEENGIGWQNYLLPRLESELNRAISSEFDLSLFVIKLPQIDRNSETFLNICKYLILQFQFKDLIFEYKDDCVVAMKINMNLDEALVFSEKIYSDIKNMIENNDCYIGISTRSIRMVSGERLLFEAEEAMQHAELDQTSPVIAFRVDSEKYRQYFEHNNN